MIDIKNTNTKVLSLDIFDTFLLRNSKPEIMRFYEVSKIHWNFLKNQGVDVDLEDLFFYRRLCHNISYRIKKIQESEREGSLKNVFYSMLRCLNIDEKFLDDLIEIEIEYEKKNLKVNRRLLKLIKAYHQKFKEVKICFVSDMYISEEKMKELILYFSKGLFPFDLYVSCDYHKTKKTGSLYDLIINMLNVNPFEIIHIGDNYKSDYLNPKNKGIQSVYLPRPAILKIFSNLRKIIFNIKIR